MGQLAKSLVTDVPQALMIRCVDLSGTPIARRTLLTGAVGSTFGVLAGCGAEQEPDMPELRMGTGPAGAVYRRIGAGIKKILTSRMPQTTVTTVPSRASTDNIRRLRRGDIHLGLANLDAALGASVKPTWDLVALGRLYDSHFHLIVLDESPVREFADLEGKRVSYGARDSGTDFTTTRLISIAGLNVAPVWLGQADSAKALRDGEIDAAFSLSGVPTPAISDLSQARPIRLIDLSAQAKLLSDTYPGPYIPANIPATTYEGVPSCATLAIPNILLARSDLPDDVAKIVTETVFAEAASMPSDTPGASQINVRTGIATGSIPLHPAAAEWFRERKL